LNGPIEANSFEDGIANLVEQADSLKEELLSGIWLFFAQVTFFFALKQFIILVTFRVFKQTCRPLGPRQMSDFDERYCHIKILP
jgi:hypothetical protein